MQHQRFTPVVQPLKVIDRQEIDSVEAPYFAEEVRRELADRYGWDKLYGGGLSVHTSVDPKYQNYAMEALREGLMTYDKRHGWRGVLTRFQDRSNLAEQIKNFKGTRELVEGWDAAVRSATAQLVYV